MIDPHDPLEVQIEKQTKIIEALIQRANREHDVGGSAYTLFQSAIALQGEVWEKTKDLERALHTLGRASNELEITEYAFKQTQRNLAVALDAMEGGFALFSDDRLEICNDFFRNLVADIADMVTPGLHFKDYFAALSRSPLVNLSRDSDGQSGDRVKKCDRSGALAAPLMLALGNDRWFQITHKQTGGDNIVVLQTEITGIVRKNRLEKNRLIDEQAHFLQSAFNHMSQGIGIFSPEGTLLIQNVCFGELLGLPLQLLHKGTAFEQILDFIKKNALLIEDYSRENIDLWQNRLLTESHLRHRIRHSGGKVLEIQVHKLPDDSYLTNIIDVTVESETTILLEKRVKERTSELLEVNLRLRQQYEEQAKVEDELRIAKEEAENAVSSKTRFFAAASHDLLQPINAAKLIISNLIECSRNTRMEVAVDRLDGSFTSIQSLLQALLDISRLESTGTELAVTSFCINEILHSVKEDYFQLAAQKNLRLDVVPCRVWVRSDQRYLLRCVQNLVVNAIQYTEKGRVLAGCRRRGGNVVLEVWDTGIGISKKNQKRIFAEFMRLQTEKSGYGMGLGLSIVERACRRLGHNVSIRSKTGVGSVFSIELPYVEPGTVRFEAKEQLNPPSQADMDLIVVIVENDPDVLFATTQKIESWGGSVLAAESTKEAVRLVRDIGMAPDIILADHQLNNGDDGIKSIIALRNLTRTHIPAIMITANREKSLIKAGQKHAFTVLTKPVQLSRLRPLIDWKVRQNVTS